MKKRSCLLTCALALALLAGCGGQPAYEPNYEPDSADSFSYSSGEASSEETSSASDPSGSGGGPWGSLPSDVSEPEAPSSPVFSITEPPLTEWTLKQPVPDFLNEEQRQLFLHAYCAASEFLMSGSPMGLNEFPLKDGSLPSGNLYETVDIDGWPYTLSQGRYRRWEDFEAMMDGLFTPEYKRELIGVGSDMPMFRSTADGQLCFLDLGRGSDIFYNGIETDTYELISQTEDELCFNLVGHYTEWDYDAESGQEIMGESYTQSYPIRMVYTDRGWRVSEIHIPW